MPEDTVLIPYPEHSAKATSELATRLIDGNLQGVTKESLNQSLSQIGYYRLKGYWYPFLTPDSTNQAKHILPFIKDTDFKEILERYHFDQELRVLVFSGIVPIEIFLKSYLATELSKATGPFGYMNPAGLPNLTYYDWIDCQQKLKVRYSKSNAPYIKHFKETYSNPLPPYWMLVGCLTYGELKQYFFSGASFEIQRHLATKLHIVTPNSNPQFNGNAKILSSWLEALRRARNMVAHHERFWDTPNLTFTFPKHRSGSHAKTWWGNDWDFLRDTTGPAAFLTMENYLLKQIGDTEWQQKFIRLMNQYPNIPITQMGFSEDWKEMRLWQ
ncbi:Abi family protein [Bifidobacterium sp. ESL0790]|uniref:Abi family protein n=1 Tax=Bifidobacterium sp. ESL0790 TaxID=2983233 RepID=UPI0023FA2022|nr:Abi family protein [Bifidobacterium sp. ESL0790]WEV72378.1 Abi family protein [Bifidobacterium sp. ESL0790]